MKKLIKFVLVLLLIALVVYICFHTLREMGFFREKVPNIEDVEWRLIGGGLFMGDRELEFPKVHGVEGVGGENSKLVDVKMYARDGMLHIEQDGEVVAQSSVLEGMKAKDENVIHANDYIVHFGERQCLVSVGVTDYRDWDTENSGFDGNLYGKYYIEIEVLGSQYRMFFFSVDE